MRVRVKVKWDDDSWRVDLPIYTMVPGTFRPLIPGLVHFDGAFPDADPADPRLRGLTCEVEVPDRLIDASTGRPDHARIRQLYRGHPRWDDERRPPDVDVEPPELTRDVP